MSTLYEPVTANDHSLGPANAAITLVEYGDYQCGFCAQAHGELKGIRAALGNRLRFVFRNFPMSHAHPLAELAALGAEAAGIQGKFWEMHDLLYQNQRKLSPELPFDLARELGLDLTLFGLDIADGKYKDRIHRDFMGGVRSGVSNTPTFFINGLRHEGTWEGGNLLRALEQVQRNKSAFYG